MRLDKFLTECGLGSRSEVKILLKKKLIKVNGKIESSPKYHVNEASDSICFKDQKLVYENFLYYMLNKPQGVVSATKDDQHQTVLDLLDQPAQNKSVFPVGRLDIDSHGLLLLTNNGALAHVLLSPKQHVNKLYRAKISGLMTAADILAFEKGIELENFVCQPAQLEILSLDKEENTSLVHINIKEGKFHQVKRMVQACGKKVIDLKRLSMGPLVLDEQLKPGEYRRLTKEELRQLAVFNVSL
ncbi:pseudouridine synthase [Streptococcus macacae]|uniref:Pseudouridine synthase n=1 Tax=Streptococcus macacae NCTC 11558 TaxID=764298 RepID=G5JZ53_9STRE|nr:pseudouridine synthase [Streptococcus macacae]EHJ53271.1 pseudouridylate synthase [Streptococcus macacae NCTC 11558]SUN78306.1 ribosomal small subunit pseudouridine synthase [Streptococcus macacae NCTC 11558]